MELRLIVFCLLFGLFACKPSPTQDTSKIGLAKKVLAENATNENRAVLLKAYQDTINTNPNNREVNSKFLQEMALLHQANKAYTPAVQTLMQSIQLNPESATISEKVWLLADIYEKNIQRPTVARIIKKLYAKSYPQGPHVSLAKQVSNNSETNISADIATLGSSMYDDQTHKVDYQAANDYIRVCELYALLQPKDGQSPSYLHKAGETARAIRAFPKAVAIYNAIYTQYPNYEKAAQALFLKAFTYDNDLKDKATAKVLYEEFLQKFPNDDFADDTQFLLKNLGKDDEEIIKSFGQE